MSTPSNANGGNGLDISALPQAIQDYIKAEIAKAVAATLPPPPKELTPAEKAVLYIEQANGALRGERANSLEYVAERLLAVVDILTDQVFPAADPGDSDEPAQPAGGVI